MIFKKRKKLTVILDTYYFDLNKAATYVIEHLSLQGKDCYLRPGPYIMVDGEKYSIRLGKQMSMLMLFSALAPQVAILTQICD